MCLPLGPPFQPCECGEMRADAIEYLNILKLLGDKLGLQFEERKVPDTWNITTLEILKSSLREL